MFTKSQYYIGQEFPLIRVIFDHECDICGNLAEYDLRKIDSIKDDVIYVNHQYYCPECLNKKGHSF